MKHWWISWYADAPLDKFEYHGPWWVSGYEPGEERDIETVCASVMAQSEDAAKEVIDKAHDAGYAVKRWRFCNEQPTGTSPWSDRFPRAKWMKWPWPEAGK